MLCKRRSLTKSVPDRSSVLSLVGSMEVFQDFEYFCEVRESFAKLVKLRKVFDRDIIFVSSVFLQTMPDRVTSFTFRV